MPPRLIDLVRMKYGDEPTSLVINILLYQLGDLTKYLFYADKYKEHRQAYQAYAKSSMADLIAQMELVCEKEHWDFWELRQMGRERFLKSDADETIPKGEQ